MRYSAFISYSHLDKRWAAWLHRSIETYRLPKSVRGRPGPFGPIAAKLPPVFRDREELSAAADLGGALNAALAQSETLIVICSPHSAGSRWVNEEIRQFISLGRGARIFCLITAGESGPTATAYMPPALLEGGRPEPLAADVRKGKDGAGPAKLKLIAGILGLSYDELRHREASRHQQRLTAIAAASVAGLVLTGGLAAFALISRNEALRERDIAEQRTTTAERTVDFVKSMFKVADPSEARGSTISAREILDRGAQRIQTGLNDEPAVKAELGVTVGEVYLSLGLYKEGDQLIRQTLQIRHGQDAVTAEQLLALADAEEKLGDDDGSIATDQRAIRLAQQSDDIGPDLKSRMFEQLSQAQSDDGQDDAAERSANDALRLDQARSPPDASDVARDLEVLGAAEIDEASLSLARQSIERALALRLSAEGPNSPSLADNLNTLGNIAFAQGDLASAEDDYRRVMAIDEKVFAADHPDVAVALNNLALVLVNQRRFGEATPLLERAVAINVKLRSDTDADMAFVYSNLALAERGEGQDAKAEATFNRALAVARAHHHRMLAPILSELADMSCRRGDVAGGKALLAEARPIMVADYPSDAWRAAWVDNVLGECLLEGGDLRAGDALIAASSPVVLSHWRPDTLYGHEATRRLQMANETGKAKLPSAARNPRRRSP